MSLLLLGGSYWGSPKWGSPAAMEAAGGAGQRSQRLAETSGRRVEGRGRATKGSKPRIVRLSLRGLGEAPHAGVRSGDLLKSKSSTIGVGGTGSAARLLY